jgi:hypothetical protein
VIGERQAEQARWREANEAYLSEHVRRLRLLIQRRVLLLRSRWRHEPLQDYRGLVVGEAEADRLLADEPPEARFWQENEEAAAIGRSIAGVEDGLISRSEALAETGRPSALDELCYLFGLTPFERDAVVLSLAPELDPRFERLYAYVQDDMNRGYPSPHLALALFGGGSPPDAWDSFTPEAPLRRFRLVSLEPGPLAGTPDGARPLRLDERIAGYLRGIDRLDDRVAHLLSPPLEPTPITHEQQELVDRLAGFFEAEAQYRWPALNLTGPPAVGKEAVAVALCDRLGLRLYGLQPDRLPSALPERPETLRLLEREAVLGQFAVYVAANEPASPEALVRDLKLFCIVGSKERRGTVSDSIAVEVPKPDRAEQRRLWRQSLAGAPSLNGSVDAVVQQFDFGPRNIARTALAAEARARLRASNGEARVTAEDLWEACREQAGWRLEELAQRIVPCSGWQDIVLPEDVFRQLQEISGQVANRPQVYEAWGFGARLGRGRGLSALFSGASGTGKTMAAEILSNHLGLDLYRIDLAGVVSKYIGETEKNLRGLFDAAERSGAILFFDEADALFGKRTEVRDSHDRYANIEVNYLLQRMEEYAGLAILATNRRSALDRAFLRRLRFLVDFPFPDANSRRRIWQKAFPPDAQTGDLDHGLLSRMEIPGGNIKNVALAAAFLAAGEGKPIGMPHIMRAAKREYAKMDRLVSQAEFGPYYPAVKR